MNTSKIRKFEIALYKAKAIVSTYTEKGRVAGLCNTIHINDFKENFNVENEFGLRYIPNFYWLENLYFSDFVPKGYIYVCPIEGTNITPSWGGAYTALTEVVSIKGLKKTEQDESNKDMEW